MGSFGVIPGFLGPRRATELEARGPIDETSRDQSTSAVGFLRTQPQRLLAFLRFVSQKLMLETHSWCQLKTCIDVNPCRRVEPIYEPSEQIKVLCSLELHDDLPWHLVMKRYLRYRLMLVLDACRSKPNSPRELRTRHSWDLNRRGCLGNEESHDGRWSVARMHTN